MVLIEDIVGKEIQEQITVTGYGVVERKPDYGYWVWKSDFFGLRVWEIKPAGKTDLMKAAILWIWGLELVTVHGKAWAGSQAGNGWNSGGRRAIWILED